MILSQWENRSNGTDRYPFATKGKESGQLRLAFFFNYRYHKLKEARSALLLLANLAVLKT